MVCLGILSTSLLKLIKDKLIFAPPANHYEAISYYMTHGGLNAPHTSLKVGVVPLLVT